MSDLSKYIESLPPKKRALFEMLLREKKGNRNGGAIPRIPRAGGPQHFDLSYAQQRLWVVDQLEPGVSSYNISGAYRLKGSLNVAALEGTLYEITLRHEILRTTFTKIQNQPAQVVHPQREQSLPVVDLSELPEPERRAEARRITIEQAAYPFDLESGPLLRTILLRLDTCKHELLMTIHHIISDGWSMGILIKETAILYEAFCGGLPSPLRELPIQYVDFLQWHKHWLQDKEIEYLLAYWKRQLGGKLQSLELPTDKPRSAVQSYEGAHYHMKLPKALVESLESLSRREEATLFMTLLAAFKGLLYRCSGQEDIILGTPIANRNRVETEGLIGFFVNMLVLRTDLSGNPSFKELLKRVREVTMGGYAHQDLPFEMLVEELQTARDLSRTPLFQLVFALQNTPRSELEFPGLVLEPLAVDFGKTMFDLVFGVACTEEGLEGSLMYNVNRFYSDTISRMANHFRLFLEAIVDDPERRLLDIPLQEDEKNHSPQAPSVLQSKYQTEDFIF